MCEKEKLIEELQKVKHRIQILDMIEERLLKMRELAVKAAEYWTYVNIVDTKSRIFMLIF